MHGTRGFNAMADGLPGVSRSVLARRLRKFEELGLIVRDPSVRSSVAPYRLAPAGEQLVPTLLSLDSWAKRWVPEDPTLAERDPSIITFWLSHHVDPVYLPDRSVVIAFDIRGPKAQWQWLVLEQGAPPSICNEDPGLSPDRYVYLEALAANLTRSREVFAVGARPWLTGRLRSSVTLGSSRLSRAGSLTWLQAST